MSAAVYVPDRRIYVPQPRLLIPRPRHLPALPSWRRLARELGLVGAIAASAHETSGSNTDGTGYTTGSQTHTSGALQLIAVHCGLFNDTVPTVTVSSTALGSWVQVESEDYIGSQDGRLAVFRNIGDGSTETVSITWSASVGACSWSWAEFTGINATGTKGENAIAQSKPQEDTNSITLDSALADAANAVYGAFGADGTQTFTAGSGFTLIGQDQRTSPNMTMCSEYDLTPADTTVDVSFGGFNPQAGIALEINASGVGGGGGNSAWYWQMLQRRNAA